MQALAHEDSSSDSSVLLRRGPKSIPLGRGLSSLAVANTAKLPSRWVLNLRACTSLAVRRVPPYLAFGPRPNVPPQRSLSGHRRPGLLLTRSLFVTLRKLGQLLQHIPSWTSPRPGLYWSQTQIYQAVGLMPPRLARAAPPTGGQACASRDSIPSTPPTVRNSGISGNHRELSHPFPVNRTPLRTGDLTVHPPVPPTSRKAITQPSPPQTTINVSPGPKLSSASPWSDSAVGWPRATWFACGLLRKRVWFSWGFYHMDFLMR